jgi:asparagine synthase (glutamine-hydrolysing)
MDASRPVEREELKKMTEVIARRGPDDEGFFVEQNIGLGFRRLSIIDLHTGHQPLSNEDDSIWIIFNGEIYNFQELKKDLQQRGHQFKTKTDTETIVHLYEEYGEDCVKYLRGMFAFVIWDKNKNQLFCARDHFGIKPFFYYFDGQKFVFGSEIKSIVCDPNIDKALSMRSLDYYLAFGCTPQCRSIYEHIHKLRPAHTLTLKIGGEPRIRSYWKKEYQPDFSKTEEEWCELIEHTLADSVKKHMVSDVPLGAFLSGGIDSSSVVALMAQQSEQPIKTFSIGFKERAFNELPYARELAKFYGTEHHEQIVEPQSVSILPELVSIYDEPFADSSAIPTYYVSKFAREHVTVVLSGDGGDELFAGYPKYTKFNKFYSYNRMPDAFNRVFWGGVHQMMPVGMGGKGTTYYLSKPRKAVLAYHALWQATDRSKLYRPKLWKDVRGSLAEKERADIFHDSNTEDFIFNMQKMDMNTFLVDDILTKVDRASMHHSLEVRVPILDHRVADLSFRIPSEVKLKDGIKKYILKKAMTPHLPPSILAHKKQGFGVPLRHWFKKELKDYINDRLLLSNGPVFEYVNREFVAKIIQEHHRGLRNFNLRIWSLLFLDEWLRQNS